jgi:hypothetical protein
VAAGGVRPDVHAVTGAARPEGHGSPRNVIRRQRCPGPNDARGRVRRTTEIAQVRLESKTSYLSALRS